MISKSEQASIMYQVNRFNTHGYKTFHICGRWFLIRNRSKNGSAWYCKIPLYLPVRLKGKGIVSNNTPSIPSGQFR